MTGESGLALTLYAGLVTWVAAGLAIVAVREHLHSAAWRRRARRIAAVRRLARAEAVRSAAGRGGPQRRPAMVVRCSTRAAGATTTGAESAEPGHVGAARRAGRPR